MTELTDAYCKKKAKRGKSSKDGTQKGRCDCCCYLCRCCSCKCCKSGRKDDLDDEFILIFTGKKQPPRVVDDATPKIGRQEFYRARKDGCSESGVFTKPHCARPSLTMEQLRKNNTTTSNLPPPWEAIKIHNSKQKRVSSTRVRKKVNLHSEKHVTELNSMIVRRLSGTIQLDNDDEGPAEKGEALVTVKKRYSFSESGISDISQDSESLRQSVSCEIDRGRRRSSFVLTHMQLNTHSDLVEMAEKNNKIDSKNDNDFITNLPKMSRRLKSVLEPDVAYTQKYVRKLKSFVVEYRKQDTKRNRKTPERWMVILFTSSEDKLDIVTEFNCNLVRFILQHHCVAYEERDVALGRFRFKEQLKTILDSPDIIVPYVYARGLCVGGVEVMFEMHRMKLVKEIFKDFTMTPNVYVDWLYNRTGVNKTQLNLNVKLTGFPGLNNVLTQPNTKALLSRKDYKLLKQGKHIIKRARETWAALSKERYSQPPLLIFVLLRRTMIVCYTILNEVFLDYLPDRISKYRKCCKFSRCCMLSSCCKFSRCCKRSRSC